MPLDEKTIDNDLALIKDSLIRLNERQADMEQKMNEIGNGFKKVQTRILGDDEYEQEGLIKEVKQIKAYIIKDKALKNRMYGGATVIAVLWTFVWEYIKSKFGK